MTSTKPRSLKKQTRTHFLWIVDPWESLDHPNDTTLRLAEETLRLGLESSLCEVNSIRWENGRVLLEARKIKAIHHGLRGRRERGEKRREKKDFDLGPPRLREPKDFTSLHFRTDPPVDLAYIHPVQLLLLGLEGALGASGARRLVNPPSVLLLRNEKLEATLIPELMPPSLASSDRDALEKFGRAERKTVLKPLHQAQSKGVELLDWRSRAGAAKARRLVRIATANFTRPVLLQRYLKEIAQGETRLWFLDGNLLACARKLPLAGDFRVNIDQGSRLVPTTLAPQERRAARKIGLHLRRHDIRLAAVDLIDGYVTDFNFTSPGLLVQMEKVLGRNLARPIIRKLSI